MNLEVIINNTVYYLFRIRDYFFEEEDDDYNDYDDDYEWY